MTVSYVSSRWLSVAALGLSLLAGAAHAGKPPVYSYSSVGDPARAPSIVAVRPSPSFVLMGGGPDVDEAFRWMIQQAGVQPGTGGRLVVIRATGDGAIVDGWVGGASLGLSSVETLVIPSTAAANDPFVNAVVGRANAVWIAGGDQSDYIKYWKGQALEKTLGALMKNNVPVGGTSAGLAVLGQFDYAALNGTVTSAQALDNPYNKYMSFDPAPLSTTGGFIAPPALANTILDSHLDARDRMGRLVTFVSRLVASYPGSGSQQFGCAGGVLTNGAARGIGMSVESALLVNWDATGGHYSGRRVTNSPAPATEAAVYFVNVTQGPTLCASGKPLSVGASAIQIRKLADSTTTINLSDWSGFPIYRSVGVNAGTLSPDPY